MDYGFVPITGNHSERRAEDGGDSIKVGLTRIESLGVSAAIAKRLG
jgi:hypothetical protein